MGQQQFDAARGLSSSVAIKGPCRVATAVNVTLYGEQSIADPSPASSSTAVLDGDRVLVLNQTDATENGIYIVSTGPWERAPDFSRSDDVRLGTQVRVTRGDLKGNYIVTTDDDASFVFGETEITLVRDIFLTAIPDGVVITTASFGIIHDNVTDNSSAMDDMMEWLALGTTAKPQTVFVGDGIAATSGSHRVPSHCRIISNGGGFRSTVTTGSVNRQNPLYFGGFGSGHYAFRTIGDPSYTRRMDRYRGNAAIAATATSVTMATPADAARFAIGEVYLLASDESQSQTSTGVDYEVPYVNEPFRVKDNSGGVVTFDRPIGAATATAPWLCKFIDGSSIDGVPGYFIQDVYVEGLYIEGNNTVGMSGMFDCHFRDIKGVVNWPAQFNAFAYSTFNGFRGKFRTGVVEVKICGSHSYIGDIMVYSDTAPAVGANVPGLISLGERNRDVEIENIRIFSGVWTGAAPIAVQPGYNCHIHNVHMDIPESTSSAIQIYSDAVSAVTRLHLADIQILHKAPVGVLFNNASAVAPPTDNYFERLDLETLGTPSYGISFASAALRNIFEGCDFHNHLQPAFGASCKGNVVSECVFADDTAAGSASADNSFFDNWYRSGNFLRRAKGHGDETRGTFRVASFSAVNYNYGHGIEWRYVDSDGVPANHYGEIKSVDRDNSLYQNLLLSAAQLQFQIGTTSGGALTETMRLSVSPSSGQAAMHLLTNNAGVISLRRVNVGAIDSGGTGQRLLSVANA